MPRPILKIRCRIEEVPTIGAFLIDSLTTDIADFSNFSPDFNAAYITNASAQLAAVETLINPKELTAELKVITARMRTNMQSLKPMISFAEGYINRASGLTILPSGFGIKPVRRAYKNGDVEKLIAALSYLLTNISNNIAALTAKGYTTAQNNAITTIQKALSSDNTAQNALENARSNHVAANYKIITDFWATCTDISRTGKQIYRASAPNKLTEYSIMALVRRIRQDQHREKLTGTVMLSGSPIFKAKLQLLPTHRGHRRTATTNKAGQFKITKLSPGTYTATVFIAGTALPPVTITITAGQANTHHFVY